MVESRVAGVLCQRMSPLVRLRTLVSAWRAAQAEQVREPGLREPGLRAPGPGESGQGVSDVSRRTARARRALGTGEARALLEECVSLGIIDAIDHRVLLGHLADAAREELLERRGCPPACDGVEEVEVGGEPVSLGTIAVEASRWTERPRREAALARVAERARRWREAHEEADATAARVLARGPAAEDEPALADVIDAFLAATDDATHEALARSQHALGTGATRASVPDRLAAFARTLRASALDALFSPERRMLRLGRALAPLGADATVASRLRVETSTELRAHGRLRLLSPPTRVVLGVAQPELGLASELAAIELFGRGMAYARCSPALGEEHRAVPDAHVPGLVGALLVMVLGEPLFLSRVLGLEARAAAAAAAVATYLGLVRARLDGARAQVRLGGVDVGGEEAHALVRRCLALPSELPLGMLLASASPSPELALYARSRALAPAVFLALRERFDEDFYRNPRAGEVLGGAMARGARLTRAAWCAELGASGDPAAAARSLVRERLR